jgi:hypothetical protein
MSAAALVFMLVTWALVVALVAFCFARVLRDDDPRKARKERRGPR